jgi:hypothetical protein
MRQPIASAARPQTQLRLPMPPRAEIRATPGDHRRWRRAVFPRGCRTDSVRRGPFYPCDRKHRRSGQPARHASAQHRPRRRHRLGQRQRNCEKADVILSVGCRLQDFTTGSWTAFAQGCTDHRAQCRAPRCGKHLSLPVVGDAKLGLKALDEAIGGYKAPTAWTAARKPSVPNGMPMSPTMWRKPTAPTGPTPMRRRLAW